MKLPEPQAGLVISYAYLWHHEHRVGREEGIKDRPCVIIFAALLRPDEILVRAAAITHRPPDDPTVAFELPASIKRHLGLDAERSWVILDEINEFVWPGFDLRPIPGSRGSYAYGFMPPRLFEQLLAKMGEVWRRKHGRTISRV